MSRPKRPSKHKVDSTKKKTDPVNRRPLLFYRIIIAPVLCVLFTAIGVLIIAQFFPQLKPVIGGTILGRIQNIAADWGSRLRQLPLIPAAFSRQVGDAVQPQMDLTARDLQSRLAVSVPSLEGLPLEERFALLQKATQNAPFGLGTFFKTEPLVLHAERTVIQQSMAEENVQGVKTRTLAAQDVKSFVDNELSYYRTSRDNEVVSETSKQKDTSILRALPAQMRLDGVKAGYIFLVEEYGKLVNHYFQKNDNENKLIPSPDGSQ